MAWAAWTSSCRAHGPNRPPLASTSQRTANWPQHHRRQEALLRLRGGCAPSGSDYGHQAHHAGRCPFPRLPGQTSSAAISRVDGDLQGLEAAAAYELNRGVTRLCPAGMSLAAEQLPKICQMAAAHRADRKPGTELAGVNLEEPLTSSGKPARWTPSALTASFPMPGRFGSAARSNIRAPERPALSISLDGAGLIAYILLN